MAGERSNALGHLRLAAQLLAETSRRLERAAANLGDGQARERVDAAQASLRAQRAALLSLAADLNIDGEILAEVAKA
jgi:hypothetical protein